MAEDQNFKLPSPIRTIVDGNTDIFRYGLFKYEDSQFEDPTYLGFTMEIDTETSALFGWLKPFLEKQGANRIEHNSRIPVYDEFVNKVKQVFKSQESVVDDADKGVFIKSHYINSISGLDSLSKKFIEWKKDSIDIELHEDIAMTSSYLAGLYNNLVYSYDTGRVIVPDNLVKFNMYIKISEIRNLTSIAKLASNDASDLEIANALKNNVTCVVYKLTDCEFDFTGSRAFADEIVQSGVGASLVNNSVLPLKIYFKSVQRNTFNPLIKKSISMRDDLLDLGVVIVGYSGDRKTNGQATDASSTTLNENGDNYQELQTEKQDSPKASNVAFLNSNNKKPSSVATYEKETTVNPDTKGQDDLSLYQSDLVNLKDYNKELAPSVDGNTLEVDNTLNEQLGGTDLNIQNAISNPQSVISQIGNNAANAVTNSIKRQINTLEDKIKQKRNELIKDFIYDLQQNVGMEKIVPNNVYTDQDYFKNIVTDVLSSAGFEITGGITQILTGN